MTKIRHHGNNKHNKLCTAENIDASLGSTINPQQALVHNMTWELEYLLNTTSLVGNSNTNALVNNQAGDW